MASTVEELLTSEEATVWVLYHRTPGLTLREIAVKIGKSTSQTSRIRTEAARKVDAMKGMVEEGGGDPGVVERGLFFLESQTARATPA